MIQPFEIAIALRYLRSKNKNRFISFISLISVAGIAIAVAVLIVVLSVMNGFEYEVRDKILRVVSHAAITGWSGRIDDWGQVDAQIRENARIRATAPFIDGQGMLVGEDALKGVEIRGVDPALEVQASGVGELLTAGRFDALEARAYKIVIGRELSTLLNAGMGDKVTMMISQGVVTPAGVVPRMRRFEIAGIFEAGMYEYDRGLVFIHIEDASRLFRLGDGITGIRLAVDDALQAPIVVREIAESLGRDVYITDWTRQHANFFRSIQLTKSIIFIILLLVVGVAAFNIVSTLVMVVREKQSEIAILRTLGAPPRGILGIFMTQGGLIGLTGTTLGIALGVVVAWNIDWIVAAVERVAGFRFLAPDIYFISDFPSRVQFGDVLTVGLIAVLLAFLSTIYPAWRGSRMQPADALRHE